MYQSVNFYDFERAFKLAGRGDNFSYDGLKALFDYLEQLEDDCDMRIELDVVALCCDYSEEPLQDVLDNYNLDSLEELQGCTMVLELDDEETTIIYQAY